VTLASTSLRTFVPGGKDFAASKRFYLALGFTVTFEVPGLVGFEHGSQGFLLQDFYSEDYANNFMMQFVVEDLDAWWAHIEALDLAGTFGVRKPKAPKMMPWGLREIHLIGPSGECWHIVQR